MKKSPVKKSKISRPIILKDALYSLSTKNTKQEDWEINTAYGKGIIVGAVSAMMATGVDFGCALEQVKSLLPKDYDSNCIPSSWIEK
jgi:hypothetical protein